MNYKKKSYDSPFSKKGRRIGVAMTVILHASLMFGVISVSITPQAPINNNLEIVIDFLEEEPKPIQAQAGIEPRAVQPEPEEEVRLVQKSEANLVSESENKGDETELGNVGDVEVKEPPRKEINQRALFSSARNTRDTIAPQGAEKVSDRLKAGHSLGNTLIGGTDGTPTAKLEGRSIMGSLPLPEYLVEKAGKVVVEIKVDQYGDVINAVTGASGTTVQDAVLWEAAKKAALKAKFNISSSSPIIQQGTITYTFNLR